jgi:UDP-N-acetylmuramate--alanine ligase
MLGVVTRRYKRSIAVSGTHGKTSTTAMLSQILIGSGFDPSAIIGGKLPFIGGNSYVGQSDIIVCEACEYVDTFLELNPFISIILNVDADHLDYFKNLDNIKRSFNKFAKQTTGLLVLNGDDENTLDSVKDVNIEKITFGFGENCDYRAENVTADKGVHEQYDLYYRGEKLCNIKLIVPGNHNVYNSLAAAVVCCFADIQHCFSGESVFELVFITELVCLDVESTLFVLASEAGVEVAHQFYDDLSLCFFLIVIFFGMECHAGASHKACHEEHEFHLCLLRQTEVEDR